MHITLMVRSKMQRLTTTGFLLLTILFSPGAGATLFDKGAGHTFGTVDQAFAFDFSQQGKQLTLRWQVKPGYYLYRQQLKIVPNNASLARWQPPTGKMHEDEFFGKTEIYSQNLILPITITQAGGSASLSVTYQGCAAAGFCYPPETRIVPLESVTAHAPPATDEENSASVKNTLPFSPLWALLIGFGIAFTPCVLPMYPLISGIILGKNGRKKVWRLLALAMAYVQGMALAYTLLGIIVAIAGLQFQAALQSPTILIGLSVIFIALALSMFGLFSLQLPSALQTRLTQWSNQQTGGSLPGVFFMGALAGLICSPCTTAPLSAILLYIAQSGNLLTGAGTLYLYALGMGIPLIGVVLFGHRLLPRSGAWMQTVKEGFGFVILTLPVFLLQRMLDDSWGIRLWSLLSVAFFAWAFISVQAVNGWVRCGKIVMLIAAFVAARPLQDWVFNAEQQSTSHSTLNFSRVDNYSDLHAAIADNGAGITMLDLYADWCVACKEFEQKTFRDTRVQAELATMHLVQADITVNNQQHRQLLQNLKVPGLPTILFFNEQGQEIPYSRVAGFMSADAFQQHLQKLSRRQN